jgi:hypothetical protein
VSADPVEAIARAVLYEGYLLWPYRRSALKNQRRFPFGGIYPAGFCDEAREGDGSSLRTEVLVEHSGRARVGIELRFLQLVHRQVLVDGVRVDRLDVGGESHLTWDEAVERRFPLGSHALCWLASSPVTVELSLPRQRDREELRGDDGREAGTIERTTEALRAEVTIAGGPAEGGLSRIAISIANAGGWRGADRTAAQRRSLLSTHVVLRVREGAFVSPASPPGAATAAAAACRNEGLWPVLVGPHGTRSTLLASPIVLDDWPRIAPESPGDLFDGGEIDQLLVLAILSLTDDERHEMAATDPRAREILERTEGLSREAILRLHGAFRDVPRSDP